MRPYVGFSDGIVGLTVQRHGGTIRLLSKPPIDHHPDYFGTARWEMWGDETAAIIALAVPNGSLTIRHQALIVHALLDAGAHYLMVERIHGSICMGSPCTEPGFENWLKADLHQVHAYAVRRYAATPITKL